MGWAGGRFSVPPHVLAPSAVGPGVQLPGAEAVGPVALHGRRLGGRHRLRGSLRQVRLGGGEPIPVGRWGRGTPSWGGVVSPPSSSSSPLFLLLPSPSPQVRPPVVAHLVLPSDGRHGDVFLLLPHFHRLLPLPLPDGHGLLRHRPQQRLPLYVATTEPHGTGPGRPPALVSRLRVSRQLWSGCPLAPGRSWGPSWVTATPPGSSCWLGSPTPSPIGVGCSSPCRCPSSASSSTRGEEEKGKEGWRDGWWDGEMEGCLGGGADGRMDAWADGGMDG